MFIDADDWLELDTVSTLVSHMDINRLDVARFNYVREFEGKSLAKENTFLEKRVYEGEECKKVCGQILGLVGSSEELAEKMIYFLENPDKVIEMGKNARERAEKYYNQNEINKRICQTTGIE